MRWLCNVLVTIALIGAMMSLGSLFARHHIIFDIGSHFRVQYIVLLLPAILFALFYKRRLAALLMIIVALVHGYTIARSLLPYNPIQEAQEIGISSERFSAASYTELHVITTNVLLRNTRFDEYLTQINGLDPDVIAVLEYTPAWHQVLSASLTDYPHRIAEPSNGGFGIALYSKYPIVLGGLERFGVDGVPSIDVQIVVGGDKIRIIAVHPPPPMSQDYYEIRNRTLRGVVDAIRTPGASGDSKVNCDIESASGTEIVVGDFNSTPWSAHFSDMERDAGITNAGRGIGILPTWPDGFFPLLIPIDHILVGPRIRVMSMQSFRVAGSDHRGLSGKFRVYPQQKSF